MWIFWSFKIANTRLCDEYWLFRLFNQEAFGKNVFSRFFTVMTSSFFSLLFNRWTWSLLETLPNSQKKNFSVIKTLFNSSNLFQNDFFKYEAIFHSNKSEKGKFFVFLSTLPSTKVTIKIICFVIGSPN